MLLTEIIPVISESHRKQTQYAELLIFKAGGTYNYHYSLKVLETARVVSI
jgi:hypothetical protein